MGEEGRGLGRAQAKVLKARWSSGGAQAVPTPIEATIGSKVASARPQCFARGGTGVTPNWMFSTELAGHCFDEFGHRDRAVLEKG